MTKGYLRNVVVVLSCVLTGCSSFGPSRVAVDRAPYDEVVRQTDSQQLLTNIVRLSYLEPTSELQVTSLTSSYSLSGSLGVSPSWTVNTGANLQPGSQGTFAGSTNTLGLTPSGTYTTSPTISYVPVNSSDVVTILQTPVSFSDLSLLFSGGIEDMELYARLIFNRMGPLDNASSSTSPRVVQAVEYQEYYKFVGLFMKMLNNGQAWIAPENFNGNTVLAYFFHKSAAQSSDAIQLKKMLRIPLDSSGIIFASENIKNLVPNAEGELVDPGRQGEPLNVVNVQTRSIYGIMSFLSHAVDIPEADIKANITQHVLDKNGQPFDWSPLMKGVMEIYSSDSEPKDAFVKTYVHGHWFYIKESDTNSKSTFSLVIRLITLVGGVSSQTNQQQAPTLTLPVGAG